ncbi:hypothetical protein GGI12_006113 [Dipsacomyces acuminosporus]|nr:hypothetical protein GGI12_006113 [Dipsacomyces acuminosporus]
MATPEAPMREILKSISFTQFPLRHIDSFFTPDEISKPQLYIYKPLGAAAAKAEREKENNGPLTSDVECLRILAILKFVNFDFEIKYTNEPNASPNGELPFLLLPDGTAMDRNKITGHLDKAGYKLPETGLKDELAYQTLVSRNLLPAIEYMIWVDQVGFETIADREYLGLYPSLIRYVQGWITSAKKAHSIQVGSNPEFGAALDGDVVYENAFRALDSLLVLLGNGGEFLAGEPSLLDAQVFACLNTILETPLKTPIRTALTQADFKYKPLLEYTVRIWQQYFSSTDKS